MSKPSRFGHLGEGWRGAKAGILCTPAALQCALGTRQACKRKWGDPGDAIMTCNIVCCPFSSRFSLKMPRIVHYYAIFKGGLKVRCLEQKGLWKKTGFPALATMVLFSATDLLWSLRCKPGDRTDFWNDGCQDCQASQLEVIPQIDKFQENGYTKEEMKVRLVMVLLIGFFPCTGQFFV